VGVNKSAKIKTQRLNFRAIVGALEAYRQDFRDYPKNSFALTDGYSAIPALGNYFYRPVPFHTDPTLAMALLGLGPASALGAASSSVGYPFGDVDGADGPGFKAKLAVVGTGTLSAASGTQAVSVNVTSVNLALGSLPPVNNTVFPAAFTVLSVGGPGSPDALVPIVNATATNVPGSTSINLARALFKGYTNQPCALLAPAGRTYEPYLPPDKFKVQYVMVPKANQGYPVGASGQEETQELPVLLDIWGGPVLYFPAYNSYNGRTYLNSPTTLTAVTYPVGIPPTGFTVVNTTVGPLFGSPSPIVANIAKNAPIDANNDTIPSVFWSGTLGAWGPGANNPTPSLLAADPAVPLTQGQIQGILLKLGDVDGTNVVSSLSYSGSVALKENFNLQQPYFLVSPGPDGKFEDPTQDAINDKLAPSPADAAIYMPKSDDVYDFDQ
jgi:hypothetical protein